jgi:hypothetical protein
MDVFYNKCDSFTTNIDASDAYFEKLCHVSDAQAKINCKSEMLWV